MKLTGNMIFITGDPNEHALVNCFDQAMMATFDLPRRDLSVGIQS
jgi:hypothetical protein